MDASQKFLVTGGAGFIGTNLVEYLINEGQKVVVVDDLSAGTDSNRLPKEADFYKLDIRHTNKLSQICSGVDVVVHLAALPRVQFSIEHPVESHAVNVNGTLSVLEASKDAGVKRVIYAASSSAYGDQETLPLSLDLPPQPKSPYALQKFIGEEMMKLWSSLYDIETVSLRLFNIYGPYYDPEGPYALVIGRFLKLAATGSPLTVTGDGTQTRDFTHVHDLTTAIMQAATLDTVGRGEVFNVGSGRQVSINELAELVGGEVKYVAARHEPKHTLADISETKKSLRWEPKVNFETGINDLKNSI